MSLDVTSLSDSGGVFSGTAVADGVEEDLERVLAGLEVDDLQGLSEHSDALGLLTGVSAVEAQRPDDSFCNGAAGLLESLKLVPAGGVGQEDSALGGGDGDVVGQCRVLHFEFVVAPLVEQLGLGGESAFLN